MYNSSTARQHIFLTNGQKLWFLAIIRTYAVVSLFACWCDNGSTLEPICHFVHVSQQSCMNRYRYSLCRCVRYSTTNGVAARIDRCIFYARATTSELFRRARGVYRLTSIARSARRPRAVRSSAAGSLKPSTNFADPCVVWLHHPVTPDQTVIKPEHRPTTYMTTVGLCCHISHIITLRSASREAK